MNTLYEKIEQLCRDHGITPGKLCNEINIRRSVLSDLKAGRKKGLSFDTLSRIANYFQIPLDSLQEDSRIDLNELSKQVAHSVTNAKTPVLTKKDERDIARAVAGIVGLAVQIAQICFRVAGNLHYARVLHGVCVFAVSLPLRLPKLRTLVFFVNDIS